MRDNLSHNKVIGLFIKSRSPSIEKQIFNNFNQNQFWNLIQYSKILHPHDKEAQVEALIEILSEQSDRVIFQYAAIYSKLYRETYTYNHWAIASILNEGCCDDTFRNFRSWVISEGRDLFRMYKSSPESIADELDSSNHNFGQCEDMAFVGVYAYQKAHWDNEFAYQEFYQSLQEDLGIDTSYEEPNNPELEITWTQNKLQELFPKFFFKFSPLIY